jgi:AraC-like DNA-binding protein
LNYTDIPLVNGYVIQEKLAEFTEHDMHMHDALEVSIPLDNDMKYPLLDGDYYAEPGDVFLFRPFEPHWNLIKHKGKPVKWVMLLFSPALVGPIPGGYSLLTPFYTTDVAPLIPAKSPHAQGIKQLAEKALEEQRNGLTGWEVQHYALLIQILVHIHRYYEEQLAERTADSTGFARIVHAIEYMMEHWSYDIDMEQVIRRTQLKKTWFYTKFKELTGLTPNDFIARLRLQYASHKLRATNETITNIALECGYGSSSYFNKVFKEYRGMTPRQYRKQ